jgi:hypothetical protein
MIETLEIKGKTDIVRDIHSKAILTVDMSKLEEHRNKRQAAKMVYENSLKVVELENDINTIKQDMSDIKLLLQQLIKES